MELPEIYVLLVISAPNNLPMLNPAIWALLILTKVKVPRQTVLLVLRVTP